METPCNLFRRQAQRGIAYPTSADVVPGIRPHLTNQRGRNIEELHVAPLPTLPPASGLAQPTQEVEAEMSHVPGAYCSPRPCVTHVGGRSRYCLLCHHHQPHAPCNSCGRQKRDIVCPYISCCHHQPQALVQYTWETRGRQPNYQFETVLLLHSP